MGCQGRYAGGSFDGTFPARGLPRALALVVTALLGIACSDNKTSEQVRGLHSANPAVRACDVVLELETELDGELEFEPSFPEHVRGASFQRGARVGLSVTAKTDAALGTFTNALNMSASIQSSTCYDRAGQPVVDPKVSLR